MWNVLELLHTNFLPSLYKVLKLDELNYALVFLLLLVHVSMQYVRYAFKK